MGRTVNAEINGVLVKHMFLMESKYDGFDVHAHERFKAGTLIAFKRKDDLTSDQLNAIFGSDKHYNIAVQWPLKDTKKQPKKDFVPSEYQNEILDCVFSTEDHLLISALAGSGKTSTLVWLLEQLSENKKLDGKRVIYLAFNKSIQEELAEKLSGTKVDVLTTHSFGFRLLKSRFGKEIEPVKNRLSNLFTNALCDDQGWEYGSDSYRAVKQLDIYNIREPMSELAGYVKNWNIKPKLLGNSWRFGAEQRTEIDGLIDMYEIEWQPESGKGEWTRQDVIDWTCRIVAASVPRPGAELSQIEYDDMLYLPLVLDLPLPHYDYVFTDESQDFNSCQIELLGKMIQS